MKLLFAREEGNISDTKAKKTTKTKTKTKMKTMSLARPNISNVSHLTVNVPQSTLLASIEPVVLFSILDHALRRNTNQKRVIGTLLGVRSDDGTEIEIRNCFAVPHNESSEQVIPSLSPGGS